MSVSVKSLPSKVMAQKLTNVERAREAWGKATPEWIVLLASHCDASNQTAVAKQLAKSGPYISRILSKTYAGSYDEAERLVRSRLGTEEVPCPLWGNIPLESCMNLRRQKGRPSNSHQRLHASTCPDCPFNTDRENGDA